MRRRTSSTGWPSTSSASPTRPKPPRRPSRASLEWLPEDKHIGLLIVPGRATAHTESVTSDVAVQFANSMLRRFDVDWAGLGFTDADLDELAEHLLRVIQSFVIDPGRPPRRGDDLRAYLLRWVGAAIRPSAEATSAARTRTSTRR